MQPAPVPPLMPRERSFFTDLMSAPDQGSSVYYEAVRKRQEVATLVASGR